MTADRRALRLAAALRAVQPSIPALREGRLLGRYLGSIDATGPGQAYAAALDRLMIDWPAFAAHGATSEAWRQLEDALARFLDQPAPLGGDYVHRQLTSLAASLACCERGGRND